MTNFSYKKLLLIIFLIFSIFAFLSGCTDTNKEVPKEEPKNEIEDPAEVEDIEELPKLTIEEINAAIENSTYLDGVHYDKDISCEKCHGDFTSENDVHIPNDETCLQCHGTYEELEQQLADRERWQEYNPHSPVHGRESCITCHKGHEPTELSCSICHPVSLPERFK